MMPHLNSATLSIFPANDSNFYTSKQFFAMRARGKAGLRVCGGIFTLVSAFVLTIHDVSLRYVSVFPPRSRVDIKIVNF